MRSLGHVHHLEDGGATLQAMGSKLQILENPGRILLSARQCGALSETKCTRSLSSRAWKA